MTFPSWIKQKAPNEKKISHMRDILASLKLNTVCESAHCPNLGECFNKGTATVMILGNSCTRSCQFCAVNHGRPEPLNPDEPKNVADLTKKLGLAHVVITSVTRDDLEDGGAKHFSVTIEAVRNLNPKTTIEVLIPDFQDKTESLECVVQSQPDIINHNLETVAKLYNKVRPQANYSRSLELLGKVKVLNPDIYTKSGIMVGLGEETEEVYALMDDLINVGCDILTIGQYLRPSKEHLPVDKFIEPQAFINYQEIGEEKGFLYVAAAPLVRSSYNAKDFFEKLGR